MAHRLLRGLSTAASHLRIQQQSRPLNAFFKSSTRNYVSEMRKSAIESNILRLIRDEIDFRMDRAPLSEPEREFNSFVVEEHPGEQWIHLSRKFGDNEEIKIDVSMFDGAVPVRTDNFHTPVVVKHHMTLTIDITKGTSSPILGIVCSAWPDSLVIHNVYVRRDERMKRPPYMGPKFKEMSDELQDSLYAFLDVRGINDKLAEFLHPYMWRKDKTEYLRWMEKLKSSLQKKREIFTGHGQRYGGIQDEEGSP